MHTDAANAHTTMQEISSDTTAPSSRIDTPEAQACRDCYDEGFAEGYTNNPLTGRSPAHLYGYQDGSKAREEDLAARDSVLVEHDNIGPVRPISRPVVDTDIDTDDLTVSLVAAEISEAVTSALASHGPDEYDLNLEG